MRRYNRELKRSVHLFVSRPVKNDFEILFWKILKNVPYGGRYSRQDGNFRLQKAFEESVSKGSVVHGDYNYHNLIMLRDDIAVTDFEHMHTDIQIKRFLLFFKKSNGKKSNGNKKQDKKYWKHMEEVRPLSEREKEFGALSLAYPEKFKRSRAAITGRIRRTSRKRM